MITKTMAKEMLDKKRKDYIDEEKMRERIVEKLDAFINNLINAREGKGDVFFNTSEERNYAFYYLKNMGFYVDMPVRKDDRPCLFLSFDFDYDM